LTKSLQNTENQIGSSITNISMVA